MKFKEAFYALALQQVKGIGSVTAKKMIATFGTAENLYQAFVDKSLEKKINTKRFEPLFTKASLLKAEKEINTAIDKNLQCLYYQDQAYPKHLSNCEDAPLLIFQDGVKNLNHFDKIISIVGTRNISAYGRSFCVDLLASLKEYNPLIVSGYAFGIDICAHLEAVKNNLSTTAVLAHGYGTIYPKEHKRFYQQIKESGGFLSEFAYDEPPYKKNFLKRNRIVAGISQATVIVESAEKGGSLVTADIANSYNKDVFAVPGRFSDTYSKGCNNLIKQHKAALITSGEDLIAQLGWEKKPKTTLTPTQPALFVSLIGDEKQLYDLLRKGAKPLHVDALARISGIPIYKVSNVVFQLEMKGLVQALPGKLVSAI